MYILEYKTISLDPHHNFGMNFGAMTGVSLQIGIQIGMRMGTSLSYSNLGTKNKCNTFLKQNFE